MRKGTCTICGEVHDKLYCIVCGKEVELMFTTEDAFLCSQDCFDKYYCQGKYWRRGLK